jgi:hypothetical protein
MLIAAESRLVIEQDDSSPDEVHARVVQWIEDAEQEGAKARELSEKDRDYYDGKQLTEAEARELVARNQPVIAFNLIQAKIDYMLGLEKQQRTDPKAFPRTPQDEEAAEAATDALRFVCDSNDLAQVRSQGWEYMIIEGACGYDVCVEPGADGEPHIAVKLVHWDRMLWDPHSRERDFSDAKWLGVSPWMDRDDVLTRWPGAEAVLESALEFTVRADTFDDRPRWNLWADRQRGRVRVVQMYWQEAGRWKYGVFTRGGWLEEPRDSPYVDETGAPECPLIFQSAYVDRENKRYGMVRNLIDPQDEINLRHRKAVHLLSVRQVIAEQGAVRDVDEARRELAKPDGYIEVAPGMRFEMNPTTDLSAGQAQLLQEAKSIFQFLGPNAALLGKPNKDASGRAIALSQQGGIIEIGALLDLHRHAQRRVCRAIWNRVKQFWTAEKWVRVTDDERNVRFVGLNQPQVDQFGRPVIAGYDEMGNPVPALRNDVSRMNVDIVIEEGPDVATLQIEQFEALAGLAKAGVPIPPDALIEASSIRNKDRILERMQQMAQQPNPALLELQRKMRRDEGDLAIAAGRLQLDAAKAAAQAETDLLAAQQQAAQPLVPVV